ncbi:hypothetical protein HMPREF9080_00487 [Cardiobacterium valvarum F0432]|uniref:Uncharacterized protein n=1 Tax=Cardiobacterium valvarum F0432 TaxID=797473 RepID=G9ZCL0_9GAMM|nr:hypothetical protein HMPREF9080_00487 [Cardiobacterium valvarum F0432]
MCLGVIWSLFYKFQLFSIRQRIKTPFSPYMNMGCIILILS